MMIRTPPSSSPRTQRGLATIMVVLLTGLALGVAVFGAYGYLSSLQRRQLTLHAATQAQLRGWSALEAARQYLAQLDQAALKALPAGADVGFSDHLADVSAQVSQVVPDDSAFCSGATRVQLQLDSPAGPAHALLDAVLCVSAATATASPLSGLSGSQYNGPLSISGDNQMIGDGNSRVLVNGAIDGSGSITGFDYVGATGDIRLRGGVNVNTLQSNGNIDVEGTYVTVNAMGNVSFTGGSSSAQVVNTNGTFTDTSAASYGTINAVGDITLGNAKAVNTNTEANVHGSSATISGTLMAKGGFIEDNCCTRVAAGKAGIASRLYANRSWGPPTNIDVVPGLQVAVSRVTAISTATLKVDANDFKDTANYIFDVDASNHITVRVNNVTGLVSGTTYFVTGSGGNQDYLCPTASFDSTTCRVKICNGYSAYNSCFSRYNGSWSINGNTSGTVLAPGVAWFKGNLNVGSGSYANTFIATGDITTAGSTHVKAPNYAGYSTVCANTAFAGLSPSNFCAGDTFTLQMIGDTALLAGSYDGGTFSGGLVGVGALNTIEGNIVAGDVVQTAGNTTITGFVWASNQGGQRRNTSAARTIYNQRDARRSSGGTGCAANCAVTPSARVVWVRYR